MVFLAHTIATDIEQEMVGTAPQAAYLTDAGGPGSLVEPPPGHSTGTDREDCAHRLESINLRGVFRFPVDRYADQILPSRPNASITGTNG